jgi:site-specific recombinase XerC
MASVFKRGRDKGKRRAFWYVSYTDHKGIRRTRKGFTDKLLTEQLGAKLENEAMLRERGLIDPEDERLAQQRAFPISGHLVAFEKSLAPNTEKYIKQLMSRVRRLIEECGFDVAGDIDPETVTTTLQDMREDEGFGHRTYNHYVQALNTFCNWLVKSRRLPGNPVVSVERLNNDVDIRHPRRALSPDEVRKLVESAQNSEESIQEFSGEVRARIYMISFMTGLRRKEIASLTPQSFDLDADPPTVTIKATVSKHRKKDVLPLHPELVTMVREWIDGIAPDQLLFEHLERRRTWLMVRKDLERVGIPYKTEEGIADFHAAGRHSHVTELLRSGASLPEARELARHADVRTTMKYTHIGMDDRAKALGNLRWQRIGSGARDVRQHGSSVNGNSRHSDRHQENGEKFDESGTSDNDSRSMSPNGGTRQKASDQVRFPPPPIPAFAGCRTMLRDQAKLWVFA